MKPNFALSLSFKGIRLLHRAAGGWRRIGEVSVSIGDLKAALEALRHAAQRLTDDPLYTTLILPDDQIKYLSIETGDADEDGRKAAARQALDGATPYPVEALVFDISAEGTATHVAAVARETLAEAEAFASEHGFNPVCFVAAPTDQPFLGAPWFGETAAAPRLLGAENAVVPDPIRVVVIGDFEDQLPPPQDAPTQQDSAEAAQSAEPGASPPQDTPLAHALSALPTSKDEMDDAPEESLFASRRRTSPTAPTLTGVTRTAPRITPHADILPAVPQNQPAPAEAARSPRRMAAFLSRRTAPLPKAHAEADRMTIFGARAAHASGRAPAYLRLGLTAAIVVSVVGLGVFATARIGASIGDWFERDRTLASTLPAGSEAELAGDVGATRAIEPDPEAGVDVAALNEELTDGLSEEDAAVLDALRDPLPEPQAPEELDAAQLEARYAVTGFWPVAPAFPQAPEIARSNDLYVPGIDPSASSVDAVALPTLASLSTDTAPLEVRNPRAPGTADVARDAQGRVLPTLEGTLSPDGYTVFAGRPPLVPPDTPTRFESDPTEADPNLLLAGVRPKVRPGNLVEQNERARLGGLSRAELAALRPRLRPQAPQELAQPDEEDAAAEEETAALPTPEPVLRPAARPRNFDRIVARTQRRQNSEAPEATQQVASVAPRTVTPSIPSSASVAREATVRNAINLRRVNLIGVYGTPADRRALVRLANGRYQKVQVGDRFDGGRISAIGDSELRYQKGGRNIVLKMPSG